ncbi:transcriptional regulator, LysR family [Catenulispora acidiphila DSM 44928]|uniref:Transcriptional regulator, LysR family n=1 Tax=Catenulispora acidiphila (strain DSM 44928 / JCM 14897 / NBRC 102108 / NRRL B-24433 / ID139908) TaxID=479433 RepID=C7Q8V5_CATAD|nr:LysR family transcriptional regulator [Catenulispora acidiphila]ACU70370.1 transcriptional regulator, LysR family [Catenulispora acidiphila DSM 44928]
MDLLAHLRYFRVVAEEQHFGRAATRLRLAQPSLSQRIQRLEREFGVRLFDRGRGGAVLTPAGRLVLAQSETVLDAADRLQSVVGRLQDGEAGTLRAAVPAHLGGAAVAALLTAFQERSPGGELDLRELTTAEQTAELAAGTLDAGIVRHPCLAAGLAFGPMLHQPLGVLLRANDPLAVEPEVDLRALTGRALAMPPRTNSPALHDETLTACARHGFTPTAVRTVEGLDFTRALIMAGADLIALIPAPPPEPGTAWRPLTGHPLSWRTSTTWRAGHDGPAVRVFADAADAALRTHAGMYAASAERPRAARPETEFAL